MPKTPISYYGGKLNMLKHILPNIPKHTIYTESFFGGGAVFFAKEPAESEIINDTDHIAMVFYEVIQSDFENLKQKIQATPFARATYKVALTIYRMPHLFSTLQCAWAFYIATNMAFAHNIGSWGYDKYGKCKTTFDNKKKAFKKSIADRLENAVIESNDAIKVIKSRDAEDAFHYVDPPYVNTAQGNYSGYTMEDYIALLDTLSEIQGKFLLSSYESDILAAYSEKHGWHTISFSKPLSSSKVQKGKSRKKKIEVLTANYPLK